MSAGEAGPPGNADAKLEFIRAYFHDLERKFAFLVELANRNRQEEALLLCCCYIEALGSATYWPEEGSKRNFVRVLKEYGEEELLWHVHAKQLRIGLAAARSKKANRIGEKLDGVLARAVATLHTEDQIMGLVGPALVADELPVLRKKLWRGTLAAVAYERIRNRQVHELGGPDAVTFNGTTFQGNPVPPLDFSLLYPALRRILERVKDLSLAEGKFFGHDFRETGDARVVKGDG